MLPVRRILIEPGSKNRKNDCFNINNGTNQCITVSDNLFFFYLSSIQ